MGLFGRLKLILHTEMNGALDALEDPKKGLDYSLLRLEENLREARQSLVEIVSAQRLLANRRDQAAAAAAHHEEQARAALAAGREELAALALGRRQSALARQADLDAAAANLQGQADALKVTLLGLQARIELLRSRKEELKAIYDSSRAQLKVREALTGLSADLDDVGHTIARAEERIRRLQARAEAVDLLAASGAIVDVLDPMGDDIDRELGHLRVTAAVEADLARLKAEVAEAALAQGALDQGALAQGGQPERYLTQGALVAQGAPEAPAAAKGRAGADVHDGRLVQAPQEPGTPAQGSQVPAAATSSREMPALSTAEAAAE